MDYGGRSGYAIEIIPDASAVCSESTIPLLDQSIWATEDDYRAWNGDHSEAISNSTNDGRQHSQSRAGSEQPHSKKPRSSSQVDSAPSKSKTLGKMFFKTKLCCKFRSGTCPYVTNCNFAHGMEELRKPPPNWQEIVAAHEEGSLPEPREEHQIPSLNTSPGSVDGQRPYKGRHCKKFYTEEGCPYGDMCTFMHDEQLKARESVTISLSPTVGIAMIQKPSNWKTRICNKWELTGYCPFGSKCHFAHGAAGNYDLPWNPTTHEFLEGSRCPPELHRYGGGLVELDPRDSLGASSESKFAGALTKSLTDAAGASNSSLPHGDIYHIGVPSQRSSMVNLRQIQRPAHKWKGPDKISRIYGDWIDDNE